MTALTVNPIHAADYLLEVEAYKANLQALGSARRELGLQQSVSKAGLFTAMGQIPQAQHHARIAATTDLIASLEYSIKITEECGIVLDCGAEYPLP